MGCCGDREKGPTEQSQKWDYITLSDFKSTSSWNALAYIWLWIMALVAVAVYAADTWTAVNLLAFNHWTSKIEPALDIKYSRWIFAGCIIFSWVLAAVEWIRAIRVIRRGGVAESYMDPVAFSVQSMRGKGWRRFLVFSALTKSKKGADYVAFFVYFAFQGAVRIILAEGPRQVINGMTLYAAAKSDLFGGVSGHSSIESFWLNLQTMFDTSTIQAVTMLTMLFTAVIWIFSAISLLLAVVFYLTFLWHYVPQRDGRLSIYCRRKIDKRLEKIVASKVKAAIEEDERIKRKAEQKAESKRQKTGELPAPMATKLARQPTLPQVADTPDKKGDDHVPEFGLARQNTDLSVSTLPVYNSRPPSRNDNERRPTLPDVDSGRPQSSRLGSEASQWSNASYASNAPLISNAGYAGDVDHTTPSRPPTAFDRQDSNASYDRPMTGRMMTRGSMGSQRTQTPTSRTQSPAPGQYYGPTGHINAARARQPIGPRMPIRTDTGMSFNTEPRSAHSTISPHDNTYPAPMRQNTVDSLATAPSRQDGQVPLQNRAPPMSRQQTTNSQSNAYPRATPPPQQLRNLPQSNFARPFSPASSQSAPPRVQQNSYEMVPQPSRTLTPASSSNFVAFNPSLHSQANTPVNQPGPQRSVTVAGGPGSDGNYFGHVEPQMPQRSATAPIDQRDTIGYSDVFDEYGAHAPAPSQALRRAGTGDERWQGRY